jgi:hypothetical protein
MRSKLTTRTAAAAAALLLFVLPASFAPAQSLADAIPGTCVLYFRDDDPIGRFEKMAGSGETWTNPKKVSERTKRSMDKAFKMGDKQLEREEGTLDGWLRSVGSVEIALFSLNFDREGGDFFPSIDYAASFESPAAIEMFNTFGKMMVDQGQATKNERGDLILGFGMGQSATISVQGNRVIMASTEDRVGSIVAALKSGMPSPLSSDPTFRACTGESNSPTVIFVRFGALLQLIRDNIPERAQQRMTEIITPLGLTKIAGIGYHEEGPNGIVIAKGSEPVPAFKLLKGKQGPPGILEKMPADCAFTLGRTDEMGPHLQRIQKYLLDPITFPFAQEVGKNLEKFKSATGLNLDEILGKVKGGLVFAGVPDETGKFDDERALVVVAKVGTKEEASALLGSVAAGAKATGAEMEQSEADGLLWLKPKKAASQPAAGGGGTGGGVAAPPAPAEPEGGLVVVVESRPGEGADSRAARVAARRARRAQVERERPKPVAVWNGEVIIAGMEAQVNRVLLAQAGKAPTLASAGAFKRLPAQATFYMTSSLKSLFAQENDFAAALSMLKDFGNSGSSMVVEDEMITIVSNRSGSEQVSAMLAAAAVGEDGGDERSDILAQLTEIGNRTRAYREKNNKWPASLADLGYSPKEMPAAKDQDGKTHAIVFLPPKADANPDDYRSLLAYFPSTDYGRLAVSLGQGSAWRWSESDFITALARYNSPK